MNIPKNRQIAPQHFSTQAHYQPRNYSNLHLQNSMDQFVHHKQVLSVVQCKICCCQVFHTSLVFICQCKHLLCRNCANKYVENCMSQNWQIICFQQQCQASLAIAQLRFNNEKMHQQNRSFLSQLDMENREVITNYNTKVRFLKEQNRRICFRCMKVLKGKCSTCKAQEIQLPRNMKSCPNCTNILQKTQGCDHIKCVCGHQFCYGCLAVWSRSHLCQFRIPKREGLNYCIFAMIRASLFAVLVSILTPIVLILILFICLISSFLLGPFLYIEYLQILTKSNEISSNLKGFIFFISIFVFPLFLMFCLIPGFYLPFVNICYKKKVLLDPDILADLVTHLYGSLNIIRLI